MTDREFFIKTVESELPRFERVMKAIPETNAEFRPDAKSKTAAELAAYMVMDASGLPPALTEGTIDIATFFSPIPKKSAQTSAGELAALLTATKEAAEKMSEEEWNTGKANMTQDGKSIWDSTKGAMVWGFLLDLIHHRGQLSTYIRPMGGKVPSIYGPSADHPDVA